MYNNELVKKLSHIEDAVNLFDETGDISALEQLAERPEYEWVILRRFPKLNSRHQLPDFFRGISSKEEFFPLYRLNEYYVSVCCRGNKPVYCPAFIDGMLVYSGKFTLVLDDQQVELREGDICIVNANVPHGTRSKIPDSTLISFMITEEYFNNSLLPRLAGQDFLMSFFSKAFRQRQVQDRYIKTNMNGNERIRFFCSALVREFMDNRAYADAIVNSYMVLIFAEILRMYSKTATSEDIQYLGDNRLDEIMIYIKENYRSATLHATAEHFHFSPNYFSYALKKVTGQTFKQLTHSARISEACFQLEHSNDPITTIAQNVGYKNISFFYMLFRDEFGMTPSEYRNRYRGK